VSHAGRKKTLAGGLQKTKQRNQMIPTIRELPLHDEASGIANLDARFRKLGTPPTGIFFLSVGMVLGACIVAAIFLITFL
jgi:hypothetical protein